MLVGLHDAERNHMQNKLFPNFALMKISAYYGHNMDALWDCLHCSFEFPTTITLKNISAIPQEMKSEMPIILELFRDLELEDEEVSVKIENDSHDSNVSDYLI